MLKLMTTLIALTAIGVGVKAKSETFATSSYNPVLSTIEIGCNGIKTLK